MQYLLDTNICIYIIKKRPAPVFDKFKTLKPGSLAISSVTLAERLYGVMKSAYPEKNKLALEKFITPLEILEFDGSACLAYGRIRAHLEKQGTPIGPLDTLIAAHALSRNLTLVTNNLKEFMRVPSLRTENWVS
jgi:tRNA(fMet)-specific endonuclease VapC